MSQVGAHWGICVCSGNHSHTTTTHHTTCLGMACGLHTWEGLFLHTKRVARRHGSTHTQAQNKGGKKRQVCRQVVGECLQVNNRQRQVRTTVSNWGGKVGVQWCRSSKKSRCREFSSTKPKSPMVAWWQVGILIWLSPPPVRISINGIPSSL